MFRIHTYSNDDRWKCGGLSYVVNAKDIIEPPPIAGAFFVIMKSFYENSIVAASNTTIKEIMLYRDQLLMGTKNSNSRFNGKLVGG